MAHTIYHRSCTQQAAEQHSSSGWVNALAVGSATIRRILPSQPHALHKAALCEPSKARRLFLGEHLSTADQPQHHHSIPFYSRGRLEKATFCFMQLIAF